MNRKWRVSWCVCFLCEQFVAEHVDALQSDASFEATISKFDSNFSTLLLDLLDKLSIYSTNDCEHSMINIIYRCVAFEAGRAGKGTVEGGGDLHPQPNFLQ